MDLLRFFTAGNVDDGKSTLIGRLLYDSHAISTDVIETLSQQSKTKGGNTEIDLALLTDGLRAEREQGITIDVAYKFFSTGKRKFIIADTPGHFEYTRNMFTGASKADLAIILVDARNGITDQTKRHSIISSILRIPHVLVCINKMDLVNYSEDTFGKIISEYKAFIEPLKVDKISFIPVSALMGENIVKSSDRMNWYRGKSLFEFLETVEVSNLAKNDLPRFQVQYIIHKGKDGKQSHRYAGKVLSGHYTKGDRIIVLPSEQKTTIAQIVVNQVEVKTAGTNSPVVIHLEDELNVKRGDSFVHLQNLPKEGNKITATLCWMDHTSFVPGQKMILQQNSFRTRATIKEVISTIDIHSFASLNSNGIHLNDICKVVIKTEDPIVYDSYSDNRNTGCFILIDELNNNTIAAGTIE